MKSSKTLLDVVSNHQIVFDYQEDAIIKKFNAALQNLDYEGSTDLEYENEALNSTKNVEEESKDIKYKIKFENNQSKEKISLESNKTITEESLDSMKVIDGPKPGHKRISSTFMNSSNDHSDKPVQYPHPEISNSLLRK